MRVLLVRHGETDWNATARWQGQTDIPLNAAGEAQARLLAERWRRERLRVDALYASDLARAFRTAELASEALGAAPVAEPALREIHVGRWAGLTSKEAAALHPELHARIHAGEDLPRGGDGERFADLVARAGAAFDRIAARHAEARILALVTHGGVVRAVLQHLLPHRTDLEIPKLHIGNTSVSSVRRGPAGWELELLDDRSHLATEPARAPDLMAPRELGVASSAPAAETDVDDAERA